MEAEKSFCEERTRRIVVEVDVKVLMTIQTSKAGGRTLVFGQFGERLVEFFADSLVLLFLGQQLVCTSYNSSK